jgi:pyrimidine deaminase RibD-like protein
MRFLEFKDSDYEIHDRDHLDKYLVELCNKIVEGQQTDPDQYGMVAACVLDPDHNQISTTSTKKDGKWRHAERNAIEAYEKTYGKIPEGSIIITTLSPCDGAMTDRYEGSCTDLINDSTVKKVYCGYMDPSQHDEDFEFTVEDTDNKDIQRLCKKFADTFLGGPDHPVEECGGTGVIASKSQAKDPRYSMSLTKDVRPGQVKKNLKAFDLAQENFADGKGPGKPGDSQRHGIPKGASMSELEKASHSKGRKGQLARWQLNMRRGHKK